MNASLTTGQLNVLLSDVPIFRGTFPADAIPSFRKLPAAIIVNTDPSSLPGEHWVSVVLKSNSKAIYFDPLGFPPLVGEMQKYLTEHAANGIKYSAVTVQSPTNKTCGLWCAAFVNHYAAGGSLRDFVASYIGNIGKQLAINDQMLVDAHLTQQSMRQQSKSVTTSNKF